jgi:hypothetical protein
VQSILQKQSPGARTRCAIDCTRAPNQAPQSTARRFVEWQRSAVGNAGDPRWRGNQIPFDCEWLSQHALKDLLERLVQAQVRLGGCTTSSGTTRRPMVVSEGKQNTPTASGGRQQWTITHTTRQSGAYRPYTVASIVVLQLSEQCIYRIPIVTPIAIV